jgi:hypothetical protein
MSGRSPSGQTTASVGTSIVPPGPRADTLGTPAPITTPQVTALHHYFAVSLRRRHRILAAGSTSI